MKKVFFALAAWALMAQLSMAAITGSFVQVAQDGNAPANTKTYDLIVNASTDWTGTNMLLHLATGSMYQHANGGPGMNPPSEALIGFLPALAWDTYATGKGGLAGGAPSTAGGAVDLGGALAPTWNGTDINQNWFTTATDDTGTFSLGRFTFSNDANGTFTLRLDSAQQSAPFVLTGAIVGGAIPEPSTIALLAVGIVGAGIGYARKRKTA